MNRVSKMMMISNRGYRRNDDDRNREEDPRYGRHGYDAENRFRDRRGREHYDDGRYAPQNMGDYDVEGRGRHDRVDWDSDMQGRYTGNVYPMRAAGENPRRKIGFSIGGEMEHLPEGSMMRSSYHEPFTRQTAEEWVSRMQNSDGTTGQHWTLDQAQQLMNQRKINCDPVRFYTALNAVFSDFGAVAKKHGVSNVEFFADLAKAWLDDKDAVPDKLEAYYEYVVKH